MKKNHHSQDHRKKAGHILKFTTVLSVFRLKPAAASGLNLNKNTMNFQVHTMERELIRIQLYFWTILVTLHFFYKPTISIHALNYIHFKELY